jgi:hypothetical protein
MNAMGPDRSPSYHAHAKSRSQTGAPSTTNFGRLPFHPAHFSWFHIKNQNIDATPGTLQTGMYKK